MHFSFVLCLQPLQDCCICSVLCWLFGIFTWGIYSILSRYCFPQFLKKSVMKPCLAVAKRANFSSNQTSGAAGSAGVCLWFLMAGEAVSHSYYTHTWRGLAELHKLSQDLVWGLCCLQLYSGTACTSQKVTVWFWCVCRFLPVDDFIFMSCKCWFSCSFYL